MTKHTVRNDVYTFIPSPSGLSTFTTEVSCNNQNDGHGWQQQQQHSTYDCRYSNGNYYVHWLVHHVWRWSSCSAILTRSEIAGHKYFTVSTGVEWCTGTVVASVRVGAVFPSLAWICLLAFINTNSTVVPRWTSVGANTVAAIAISCV